MTEAIDAALRRMMNTLAYVLDDAFNADDPERRTGFALLVFPMETPNAPCNYISNGRREDLTSMLRELLSHLDKNEVPHV